MRIGVDLGGTKIEAVVLDDAGIERFRRRVPTPRNDYAATVATIGQLADEAERATGPCRSIGVGIPGLTFLASGTFGSGALDAATGLPLPQNNEYDFDLIFQVAAKSAPEWLKPLQLRRRMAHVDQWFNGTYAQINDYRVILNYEVNLKGFRR